MAEDIYLKKKLFRQTARQHIAQAKALDSQDFNQHSDALTSKLLADPVIAKAHKILAFWPLNDEINVVPSIDALQKRGQQVYLPVVVKNDLIFRLFTGHECLAAQPPFGILEPQETEELATSDGSNIVALVPGFAFCAASKARMGRGKGFYDRFLPSVPKCYKIGVCYSYQLVENIVMGPDDIYMDNIIYA